ncbi:hypothetical protein OUZ56_016960 [Daphnia magna]|uniref:Uncharacterized protein n=1 Tax=Daphnia magna TaxID=35525 RepID=A0ABR0ARS7_9CRUS|nr:hypothetical protein OUZ56_016960 [Daphnia magna]
MGTWVLSPSGIKLLTNNQSESFNASMKRLINWKQQTIDVMANSLRKISLFYAMKIRRGRLGCRDYTLFPHSRSHSVGCPPDVEVGYYVYPVDIRRTTQNPIRCPTDTAPSDIRRTSERTFTAII